MYNLTQKLTAEFLGAFAFTFFGAGAICADRYLQGSGGIGPLAMAVAPGLAMGILVSALGHISGGHFNPAITIGLWVTRRIGTADTLAYWAAQLGGAVAAAFLLKNIVQEDTWRAVALALPSWHGIFRSSRPWASKASRRFSSCSRFSPPSLMNEEHSRRSLDLASGSASPWAFWWPVPLRAAR